MRFLSLLIGKTVFALLRLTGRTGSALPGLIIEKIQPNFLAATLGQLPLGVVVLSGTNGKTTTTKILTCMLEAQGLRVLTNKTGSNFVRGIISVVVDKTKLWSGKLPYDIAILEQDEAHAVHFARLVKPRGVIVLNIMRDQMDRFGEIDTTLKLLGKLTESATDWVVLNANDERVSTLAGAAKAHVHWYGHSAALQSHFLTDDQLYHAESLAFHEASPPDVILTGYDDSRAIVSTGGVEKSYSFALRGGHNALNLCAALAALEQILPTYEPGLLETALQTMQPAFGRGEVIELPGGGRVTLQLIKNPGGFTQALRMLEVKNYAYVGIAINDDYPDGRDVSWLWDVNFEMIRDKGHVVRCGGTRGADMANRLKYDNVQTISITDSLPQLVQELNADCTQKNSDAILYCTYTAMLAIRELYRAIQPDLYEVEV